MTTAGHSLTRGQRQMLHNLNNGRYLTIRGVNLQHMEKRGLIRRNLNNRWAITNLGRAALANGQKEAT